MSPHPRQMKPIVPSLSHLYTETNTTTFSLLFIVSSQKSRYRNIPQYQRKNVTSDGFSKRSVFFFVTSKSINVSFSYEWSKKKKDNIFNPRDYRQFSRHFCSTKGRSFFSLEGQLDLQYRQLIRRIRTKSCLQEVFFEKLGNTWDIYVTEVICFYLQRERW